MTPDDAGAPPATATGSVQNLPVLAVRGISKRFPGVQALVKVDFDVYPGEVHVLLGENGAGKSTLMKILSGAYTSDEGEIIIRGRPVEIRGPRHAQELGISTIYQTFNQAQHLTVGENLLLGREPAGRFGTIDWRRLSRQARAVLDRVGLQVDSRARVMDLSVAQRQMVEIAKALSLDASVLIMDEPTSALTDRETRTLFEIVRALRSRGVSIIYISHRLEEVREIGDRVTVLRDGRKVATLPIGEAHVPVLIRMMVGRDLQLTTLTDRHVGTEETLRVEGLTRVGALDHVGFTAHRGEIVSLAGQVGSGRTGVVRAIFGVDPLDAGQIYVNRRRVRIRNPRDAVRHGLGLLTEDRLSTGLALTMTVGQNITLPSLQQFEAFGILRLKSERRAMRRAVDQLNIATTGVDQPVRFLSGGNQQKVVLAKWLMARSQILFLDEPTQGIDVGAKEEVHRLMVDFTRRQGGTVILISSDLPEVLRMSDRILVMRDGRIVAEMPAVDATQEQITRYAVGVEPIQPRLSGGSDAG
jgi:ribose transport system ATP-binding protein